MVTRLSKFFLRTLREDPAGAEVASHKLLIRAGYIRPQAAGIFAWLPLGLRVKAKIETVVRGQFDWEDFHVQLALDGLINEFR